MHKWVVICCQEPVPCQPEAKAFNANKKKIKVRIDQCMKNWKSLFARAYIISTPNKIFLLQLKVDKFAYWIPMSTKVYCRHQSFFQLSVLLCGNSPSYSAWTLSIRSRGFSIWERKFSVRHEWRRESSHDSSMSAVRHPFASAPLNFPSLTLHSKLSSLVSGREPNPAIHQFRAKCIFEISLVLRVLKLPLSSAISALINWSSDAILPGVILSWNACRFSHRSLIYVYGVLFYSHLASQCFIAF